MTERRPSVHKAVVVSLMVGLMMGLILLVFTVLEDSFGHAIAIASFAATTVSVFLHSRERSNQPLVISACYLSAAVVGYGAALLPVELFVQVAVALFVLVLGFLLFNTMHPPAVAYAFGFMLGGYGMLEVALTIPALFVYFFTLGVVILVVERAAVWIGWLPEEYTSAEYQTWYEWIEDRTHRLVPYALVLLFASILTEFLYPEIAASYVVYLRVLDGLIIALFVADLTFIYRRAQSAAQFLRHNWIDIVATIPFFIVFRFFQGAALVFALVARGSAEAVADAARFSRFARPVARTPRFARLLDRLDEVGL